ncbi:MmgE/PrpD family protein [Cupriavidus alkaliphilus]|uniref:2-methylcitrate dehydratase PrpD n=1 Tax=Cupriavidus alkaliphilus TaxID=942866 RepID=A0A7W4V933_9BURK|nr:MmgE/PrpD family protein [Cupriavidus alkaliphilus]MBB3007324.1 2-methylcitrate dehydratase PrpD [Cupriavidus alkaliphilus]
MHQQTKSVAITRDIAGWIAGIRNTDLPDAVRQAVGELSLDTFGAGLTGHDEPWSLAISGWASEGYAAPCGVGARAWGRRGRRYRAADAALVNGAAAHAYELDDFHNAKVHLGAVVLPAVFALAETLDAPPGRVETAIAVGYETMIRCSLALQPARARMKGWHMTAVCAPIGAAAASAVMLGLDAERTAWALGLAGTQSGGLFAFACDGTDSKRFHPGRGAQAGVMAAELAARGLSGPTRLFETADGGWLKAFSESPRPEELLNGLGSEWHMPRTNFKPYACCGSAHAHVDCALRLRGDWAGTGPIRVGMPTVVDVQCGYRYVPGSVLNAQMSARYALAVALLDGEVLPAQFAAGRLSDPEIVGLANAIEIVRDPELDALYPASFCGWVELQSRSGVPLREDQTNPSGSAENPVRTHSIQQKFRALTAGVLVADQAQALINAFGNLATTPVCQILDTAEPVA